MMSRSMPPASADFAERPVPAPPPMSGRPAATVARNRSTAVFLSIVDLLGARPGGRRSWVPDPTWPGPAIRRGRLSGGIGADQPVQRPRQLRSEAGVVDGGRRVVHDDRRTRK